MNLETERELTDLENKFMIARERGKDRGRDNQGVWDGHCYI